MTNTVPELLPGTWLYTQPLIPSDAQTPATPDLEREREWSEVVDKLLSMRTACDDWDGEGSRAPGPILVDAAITLVQAMKETGEPAPHFTIASDEGSVWLEWHFPTGNRIVEVVSPTEAEFRWIPKGPGKAFQARYLRNAC